MRADVIQRFTGIQGHTMRAVHFVDKGGRQTDVDDDIFAARIKVILKRID